SIVLRRTCPTPRAKIPFAGMILAFSAPTSSNRIFVCFWSPNSVGTLTVVQSRYSLPCVSESVDRITTCPEKGSCRNIYSNAESILSGGNFHATSAPSARLVASNVCRTRRIVPAFIIALIRSSTRSSRTPDNVAISLNGSRTNPWILSSEIARILELTASVCSVAIMLLLGQETSTESRDDTNPVAQNPHAGQ